MFVCLIIIINIVYLQEAECEKLRLDAKYMADTKVADSKRQFEMQKAAFDMEVNARVMLSSIVTRNTI